MAFIATTALLSVVLFACSIGKLLVHAPFVVYHIDNGGSNFLDFRMEVSAMCQQFQIGAHRPYMYLAPFNYHHRPIYWINFRLVINSAHSCLSSIDCMCVLVIKTAVK